MPHLLALLLLCIAPAALAEMARVLDGDTLELSTGERIRLWGIDAPEGSQVCQRDGPLWHCGDDATAAMRVLVNGRDHLHRARRRSLRPHRRDVQRGRSGHRRRHGPAGVGPGRVVFGRRLRDRAARGGAGGARAVVGIVHGALGINEGVPWRLYPLAW
jgi:hypothetical protein